MGQSCSLLSVAPDAPLASSSTVSLVEVSPSMEMRLKLVSAVLDEELLEQRGFGSGVGAEIDEHGGMGRWNLPDCELGMNHACTFGDAGDPHLSTIDLDGGMGGLGPRVGGHDRGGDARKMLCCIADRFSQRRKRRADFLDGKGHADDPGGGGKDRLWCATEGLRGSIAALLRGGDARISGGAVGIAGVDKHGVDAAAVRGQMAAIDEERRSLDLVGGVERGGGRGLRRDDGGEIGAAAGFNAGPHGSPQKSTGQRGRLCP